jgi:hypothetical protein
MVYLDLCCFKRPFERGGISPPEPYPGSVRSPAHDFENEQNPREDRRLATRLWLQTATVSVAASHPTGDRARALAALGFAPLDALHLAFAEASAARWFVTTDDRLLKVASRHREQLRVDVVRPDQVPLGTAGDQS